MMIIDMHNHIGLSKDGAHGRLDELIENMAQYGIERSVLFATDEEERGPTFRALNTKIMKAQQEYPDKIIAFARIVPMAGKAAMDELQRCCKLGARGLKLKPTDGFHPRESEHLLEMIKDKKYFPVLIHTSHEQVNHPTHWEEFFGDFPGIQFILAHGGKDVYRACAKIVKKHPNVYVDTTTLSLNRTRHLYDELGPEKIVFASDYPYSHPAVELKKFELIVRDKKALDLILYKNAARLLGLK